MIWITSWYLLTSIITFTVYGLDKRKARLGNWRIKENTLHLMDFLGGWPGGLAGQRFFQHKSRKTKFQAIFWAIVMLHLAGWTWYVCRRFSST